MILLSSHYSAFPQPVEHLQLLVQLTALRPILLRTLTQLPLLLWAFFLDILLWHHFPNRKILLMTRIKLDPMIDLRHHLLPRLLHLPLMPPLLLRRRQRPLPVRLLRILDGDIHLLDPTHIPRKIFLETARHKRASSVTADEEVVSAAGAVDSGVRGDVDYCAIEGEVDG